MFFEISLGIPDRQAENVKVNQREAFRAVIIRKGLLLMLKTNKGDMKFPGGGRKINENHEKALIREVREETGYLVKRINGKAGVAIERIKDAFEPGALFEMVSH